MHLSPFPCQMKYRATSPSCPSDVLPPRDLQFSPHQHPHSLTIMWRHPECSASSYVSSYEVIWCKRNSDDCDTNMAFDCCLDKSSKTISRVLTEWTLNDLDINSEYEVTVTGISFNKVSPFKDVLVYRWPDRGWSIFLDADCHWSLYVCYCPTSLCPLSWSASNRL